MPPRCPYCRANVDESTKHVSCRNCGAWHHSDCWKDNGGCTVFGCASRLRSPSPFFSLRKQTIFALSAIFILLGGAFLTVLPVRDFQIYMPERTFSLIAIGIIPALGIKRHPDSQRRFGWAVFLCVGFSFLIAFILSDCFMRGNFGLFLILKLPVLLFDLAVFPQHNAPIMGCFGGQNILQFHIESAVPFYSDVFLFLWWMFMRKKSVLYPNKLSRIEKTAKASRLRKGIASKVHFPTAQPFLWTIIVCGGLLLSMSSLHMIHRHEFLFAISSGAGELLGILHYVGGEVLPPAAIASLFIFLCVPLARSSASITKRHLAALTAGAATMLLVFLSDFVAAAKIGSPIDWDYSRIILFGQAAEFCFLCFVLLVTKRMRNMSMTFALNWMLAFYIINLAGNHFVFHCYSL